MKSKPEQKILGFILVMGLTFMVLGARLYYLQVIRGDYYLQRSASNFLQERVIKHNRGKILDSEYRVLVDNRLSYDLYITFALLPDSLKNLRVIGGPLKISKNDLIDFDQELMLRAKSNISVDMPLTYHAAWPLCRDISALARTKMILGVKISEASLNTNTCDIAIDSMEFPSLNQTMQRLRVLLGMEDRLFLDYWQKTQKRAQGLGRFKPGLLLSDIGFDAYARIENAISLGQLAGVTVVPSKRRRYIYDDFATHVIGYLNQVSVGDLREDAGYRSGDYIGRRGIEAAFENELRGQDGIEQLVVDAKGRRFSEAWEGGLLGSNRIREPRSGFNLKLSIDFNLQKRAQELFKGISGSVVVMDVNTGFIKAMASFPGFDPNIIVGGDNAKLVNQLLKDKARPFRNKAMQDHYSPGSTFKPFTAIAGMTNQVITPNYIHNCTGSYRIHKIVQRCFKRQGHGFINLAEALRVSCDSYFYELGHRLGLDALAETSATLGFGGLTGVTLPGETPGILPTRSYYKKRFGYVAPGFVVNMAIGQGDLSVTPLQLAVAYGAIANGGTIYKPQLVEEILDQKGMQIKVFPKVVKSVIADSSYDFAEIVRGLSYLTQPGGSAYSLRYRPHFADIAAWIKNNQISIVGKTGTAQVVKLSKTVDHIYDIESIPYEQRDHSWFVGLFDEIVVVVMTEHGGFGMSSSGPVAVRLMKHWHEHNTKGFAKRVLSDG